MINIPWSREILISSYFFLKLIIIWHKIVWLIVPWGLRNFIFIFEILKEIFMIIWIIIS